MSRKKFILSIDAVIEGGESWGREMEVADWCSKFQNINWKFLKFVGAINLKAAIMNSAIPFSNFGWDQRLRRSTGWWNLSYAPLELCGMFEIYTWISSYN